MESHLGHGRVDLQNLLVTFDLANADFAGEQGGGGAVSLQTEGTVQGLLVAAPHLGEGELLTGRRTHSRMSATQRLLHQTTWPPCLHFLLLYRGFVHDNIEIVPQHFTSIS